MAHHMIGRRWLPALLIASLTACGPTSDVPNPYPEDSTGVPAQPAPTLAVMLSSLDVLTIEVCAGIPQDEVIGVLGRDLVRPPEFFSWAGADVGCFYDAGRDGQTGNTTFAYVIIGPTWLYEVNRVENIRMQQPGSFADESFAFKGPDAQQLWVLLNGRAVIMVAIGDRANLSGAHHLASLAAALIP